MKSKRSVPTVRNASFQTAGLIIEPIKILLFCLISLSASSLVHAQNPFLYEYDFNCSNPNISGALFLDAPTSTDGSLTDIGSASYLAFNIGEGIPPVTIYLDNLSPLNSPVSFQWNSAMVTSPLFFNVNANLSRELVNPNEPNGPEYDAVRSSIAYVSANGTYAYSSDEGYMEGDMLQVPTVGSFFDEVTVDVNGSTGQVSFPGPDASGQWLATTIVPEPGEIESASVTFLCAGVSALRCKRKIPDRKRHLSGGNP